MTELRNITVDDLRQMEGQEGLVLTGRNLSHIDRLVRALPESGYVGTVLSPHVLIRASYQSRQFQNHFGWYGGCVSLSEFCEKNHLPQPDVSGMAFGQQEQAAAPQMTMGDRWMKALIQAERRNGFWMMKPVLSVSIQRMGSLIRWMNILR